MRWKVVQKATTGQRTESKVLVACSATNGASSSSAYTRAQAPSRRRSEGLEWTGDFWTRQEAAPRDSEQPQPPPRDQVSRQSKWFLGGESVLSGCGHPEAGYSPVPETMN